MPILSAENSFRKGLVALVDGDPATAATHFQAAIQIERQHGVTRPQMRYLSYFGLSIAQSRGVSPEAIQACETATRRDFFNPDLYLNLGRVYALAGKTTKALHAFDQGLTLAPSHKALRGEMQRLDRRAAPPLTMVSRNHPMNRFLGRLRASVRSHTPRWIGGVRTQASS